MIPERKISDIHEAIAEARRFIFRANAWKTRLMKDTNQIAFSKEGSAAKRASMDLSRALTEIRK
jgi:hypothetical protein